MIAEFDSDCAGCGSGISKGDKIHHAGGVTHCEDCGPPQGDERLGSATGMEDAPGYVRVLKKQIDDLEKKLDESLMILVTRLDLLHGWALDLSNELNIEPPKLETT